MRRPFCWTALLTLLLTTSCAHAGNMYYVSPSGSDSAPCSQAQPCQTIDRGVRALASGDTLYLRGGNYGAQQIGQYGPTPVPSGSSWETATTIASYPGETATFQNGGISMVNGSSYIIFDRLIMYNGGLYLDASAHHIRFQNGELSAQEPGYNIVAGRGAFLEVLNSKIHGAMAQYDLSQPYPGGYYGFYWQGSDSVFDGNEVYDNSGYGFHIFSSGSNSVSNNMVSNNTIYGNGFDDGPRGQSTCAVILSTGAGNKACNNVVYRNKCGIQIDYRCNDCQVIANTVYDNQDFGIAIAGGSHRVVVKDNVTWGNGQEMVDNVGDALLSNNRRGPMAVGERQQASAGECPRPSSSPPTASQPLPPPRNVRSAGR
jgi:parallel beta-helix repeat protein